MSGWPGTGRGIRTGVKGGAGGGVAAGMSLNLGAGEGVRAGIGEGVQRSRIGEASVATGLAETVADESWASAADRVPTSAALASSTEAAARVAMITGARAFIAGRKMVGPPAPPVHTSTLGAERLLC